MRIIIECGPGITEQQAILAVFDVIVRGKVSSTKSGGPQYAFHTSLKMDLGVHCRVKRKPSDPESFVVHNMRDYINLRQRRKERGIA